MWQKTIKENASPILIMVCLTFVISYFVFHTTTIVALRVALGFGSFYLVGLSWSYVFWSSEEVNGIERLVCSLTLSFFSIPPTSLGMVKIGLHLSIMSLVLMMTLWLLIALMIREFLVNKKQKDLKLMHKL